MNMVIVTLSTVVAGAEKSYDMEMPCQVPAKTLATHICQTLSAYTEGRLKPDAGAVRLWCRRLARFLAPEETLETAGIWNGDHLDLK